MQVQVAMALDARVAMEVLDMDGIILAIMVLGFGVGLGLLFTFLVGNSRADMFWHSPEKPITPTPKHKERKTNGMVTIQ